MGKKVDLSDLADEDFEELDHEIQHEIPNVVHPEMPAVAEGSGGAQQPDTGLRDWMLIPEHAIALNPLNKRYPGEDPEVANLADTIKSKTKVIQPLVVCSRDAFLAEFPDQADAIRDAAWVVLIGNRRLMGIRKAGVDDLVRVIVNDDLAANMYLAMLIENGHHESLPPMLEAEGMREVLRKENWSKRELARQIGKTHTYVNQRLTLLNLVPELRRAFEAEELKIELARQIGDLSEAEQNKIVAAGKPYRLDPSGNGVSTPSRQRTIRVSTPAIAAASIRQKFTSDELAELIRLLTEDLDAATVEAR